jgi:LmeA-like phospholipid-binding
MRLKLTVALVVLAALLFGADRPALRTAEQRIAAAVQSDAHLRARPTVTIHGFPFLVSAIRGRYGRIDVRADDVFADAGTGAPADGSVVTLQLHGVRVPLSQAISGRVARIPIDRIDGTAQIPFADIAAAAPLSGVTVAAVAGQPQQVVVGQPLDVGGVSVDVEVVARVAIAGTALTVTPVSASATGGQVPEAVLAQVRARMSFSVPVPALPHGVELSGVSVDGAGVVVGVHGAAVTLTR